MYINQDIQLKYKRVISKYLFMAMPLKLIVCKLMVKKNFNDKNY